MVTVIKRIPVSPESLRQQRQLPGAAGGEN